MTERRSKKGGRVAGAALRLVIAGAGLGLPVAVGVGLVVTLPGAASAQVLSSPPRREPPPVNIPPRPVAGRVPNLGRLPLLEPINPLGTDCVLWGDQESMRRLGIAKGWHVFGAMSRQSFVGLDARGRVRYLMDSMLDQLGQWRDREEVTIQFLPTGKVEVGRRVAWNIGGDAGSTLPLVSELFPSDTARGYAYAVALARLCRS
ncbi:MAG: hypothetical protein ACYC0B_11220 [Gemmatimonadaceae bacterium]